VPSEATGSRLERILLLVPWVVAHPGVTVDEVCAKFGVTREELMADLDLLFVCGLPPFGPGDLIEAFVDGDTVHIDMADYLARPMRLTRWEALALLVMGRAIASLPGLAEANSLSSALTKLEQAVAPGDAPAAKELADHVAVDLDRESSGTLVALRLAIAEGRRVRMSYFSFGRSEMTERTVCPLVVFTAMGRWYLEALDDLSGEDRVFRVDRIREIGPTGEPCAPEAAARRAPPEKLFVPSEHDLQAVIEISPAAAWVRETTPFEKADELPDGWVRLTLRTPHFAWLERLLLHLGPDARRIDPPELAQGVKELAKRALERYEA
jgi:proteasome accessory factor C